MKPGIFLAKHIRIYNPIFIFSVFTVFFMVKATDRKKYLVMPNY